MKVLLLTILFTVSSNTYSQIDTTGVRWFKRIALLVREDRIKELSTLVAYPLERENPLPDIESKDAFVLYYPTLFDSTLKSVILKADSNNIWQRYWYHTVAQGEIWLQNQNIITINYSSEAEKKLKDKLIQESKKNLHPSVNEWKQNIFICKTEKYLVRIDKTDKGLRYSSWSVGKQMSDPPDMVLYNGEFGAHGTQGGIYYLFKNGTWSYMLDQWDICDYENHPEDCGLNLVVKENDNVILKLRCTKIK